MARALAGRWWTRPRAWEALAAGVFTTVVAWPWLSLSQYVTAYDTVTYSGPNTAFSWAELKAGRLPTWDPTIFGGATHLGNPPAAVLYPVKLPFLVFDPARAMTLITATHLYLLAAGTFVLLAWRLRLRPPAAFVGTAALVGSGLVMVRSIQFEQIAVIAWVPWALVVTDWAVAHRRFRGRPAAATAGVVAMVLVAGHPQQVYMAVPVIGAWVLVRALDRTWADGERWTAAVRRLATPIVGGLVGVGLAAAQLAVVATQVTLAASSGARTLQVSSVPDFALTPDLVVAALLGSPLRENQLGTGGPVEAATFVGVVTVVLALVGVGTTVTRHHHRLTGAVLGVVAVAGVVLATGPQCTYQGPEQVGCDPGGIVYRRAFAYVPGFDQARVPARWLLVSVLALAILAALGTDAVARRGLTRRAATVAGGLGLAAVIAAVVARVELGPPDATDGTATLVGWIVLGALTVAAVVVATIGRAGARRRDGSPSTDGSSGWPPVAGVVGVVGVAMLVAVELGAASLHSAPRALLADQPFTALGGPVTAGLAAQPDRMLSIASQPPDYGYLTRALRPNTNETFGVRNLDGYDGGVQVTKPWVAAMAPLAAGPFNRDLPLSFQIALPVSPERLARFGTRYVIIDPVAVATVYGIADPSGPTGRAKGAELVVPGWKGPVLTDGTIEVWENPAWRAEAHVAYRTRVVPDAPDPGGSSAREPVDTWLATWTPALRDADPSVALVAPGGPELACADDRTCAPTPVAVERPHPGVVRAEVDLAGDGLLVVPELHARGWTATVDGTAADIVSTDAMSQGVRLGPGRHTVELSYRPPGFGLGLVVSIVSLMIVAALAFVGRLNPPSAGEDLDQPTATPP
jgi:hypothetical protein